MKRKKLAINGGAPLRKTPFITKPYYYSKRDTQNMTKVLLSGNLTHSSGTEIKKLESEFSEYCGTKYSLATNSGTSALQLAVKAAGINVGDEVIVPAYTFIATAQAVLSQGGIPVFADIDETFCISPESVKKVITDKTKAIIMVHIFGNVAKVDEIKKIINDRNKNIVIIEDCAQAIGAECKGKKVGGLGNIGCFSFNEKKALPTGQGGMFTTSNHNYYRIAAAARNTGIDKLDKKKEANTIGYTLFITEMQAVLARSVLKQLDKLNKVRRKNYAYLNNLLAKKLKILKMYKIQENCKPSFSRLAFTIKFERFGIGRDWFVEAVREEGIPVRTFYPVPLYKYRLFQDKRDYFTKSSFPFSESDIDYKRLNLPFVEKFCAQQVAMEFSPYLVKEDLEDFIEAIFKVLSFCHE